MRPAREGHLIRVKPFLVVAEGLHLSEQMIFQPLRDQRYIDTPIAI